jgi:hypothetical protein
VHELTPLAIALYRALLSQCRAVPFNDGQRNALQNIVRNRFRANRELRGSRRVKLAFTAGYTAIDHLDRSVAGNEESTSRIKEYLSQVPSSLKRNPKPKPPPKPDPDPTIYEPPPEHKFLNVFPRPTVVGIRKVPFLVSAGQLPFVRFKKPQPSNVSRVLRDLRKQREVRFEQRYALQDYYIPLAEYEDQWDVLVGEQNGEIKSGMELGLGWAHFMRVQRGEISDKISDADRKSKELAATMLDIINSEARLAEKETRVRRRIAWSLRQGKKDLGVMDPEKVTDPPGAKSIQVATTIIEKETPKKISKKSGSVDDKAVVDALSHLERSYDKMTPKRSRS